MTNITFFLIFVPILSTILLLINFILAPHKPNRNKDAQFECGFSSFTQMSRLPFSVSFFIYALLFLLFDLEILLVYPYVVSAYKNSIYGLTVMLVFFILLTIGFIFELGKKALVIDSRQTDENFNSNVKNTPKYNLYSSMYILYFLFGSICMLFIRHPVIYCLFVFIISIIVNCQPYYCDSSPEPTPDINPELASKPSSEPSSESDREPSSIAKGKKRILDYGSDNDDNNNENEENERKKTKVEDDSYFDSSREPGSVAKGKQRVLDYGSDDNNNTDNNNVGTDVNRINADTNSRLERPFTMETDSGDFWESTYNDDDRRHHLTAIDRLGIDPEQWDDSTEEEKSELRKAIEGMMYELRSQEQHDLDIAKGIEESVKTQHMTQEMKDEEIAKHLQESVYEGNDDDSNDTYSVVSSIRGDESPQSLAKKLDVKDAESRLPRK